MSPEPKARVTNIRFKGFFIYSRGEYTIFLHRQRTEKIQKGTIYVQLNKVRIMSEEENLDNKDKKVKYSVLSKKLGGGPKGLGDPDDKSLRKVEKDVLVAKIVRDRTRDEKCVPEVAEFNKCCQETKYAMVYKCRKENTNLQDCLIRWYKDQDFWNECTEQYLKQRSEFRKTGEPKKIRDFKARFANSF